MKTIVLDSYALLAYFEKEAGWKDVAQLLADAAADRCALQCCVVHWGEVLYITERVYGADKAEEVEAVMDDLPIEFVDADRFASGLALMADGEVVTGDPEFEAVDNRVTVRWLKSN